MNDIFRGTGVAIVTPFHKHGTIDFTAFERLIEHLVSNKVDYIVVMGTTGESVTLAAGEKSALLHFAIETINKRLPLVAGVGGNDTQAVVDNLKALPASGVDGILSVSPYYNKPQQRGIYLHYKNVSIASPFPLIIYNVPGRTGSNITADTTLQLAREFPNIIGVKEASGNLAQCMQIIKHRPSGFLVISGDDILTLPLLSLGGDGVISVVANAYPWQFSSMVRFALAGEFAEARKLHYLLTEFIEALFADGNPAGIKAALDIMGLISNNLRLPVVKVNKEVHSRISTLIKEIDGHLRM